LKQNNYLVCFSRYYVRKTYEILIIIISYLINLILYTKKIDDPSKIKKILIIKLDHIGDVILATPVITNVKKYFKNAKIDMLVNSLCVDLVNKIPYVDKVIEYDSLFFKRNNRYNIFKNIKTIKGLFKAKYELIIDLRGSFGTLILALFKGAKYRVDFGTNSIKNRKVLLKKHKFERNLEIIKELGVNGVNKNPLINLTPREGTFVINFLNKCSIKTHDLKITINPGASRIFKAWPKDNYTELIRLLTKKLNAKIILIGSKDELNLAESIQSGVDSNLCIATGKTNLRELTALIKGSDLYIGNDSATAHIAAAVGTPLIALFGPESPDRFGPLTDKKIILQKKVECSPCGQYYCSRKPNCMELIKVDNVFNAVTKSLKKWRN